MMYDGLPVQLLPTHPHPTPAHPGVVCPNRQGSRHALGRHGGAAKAVMVVGCPWTMERSLMAQKAVTADAHDLPLS